ncbi:flagellar hook capping protein [Desulfovibrio sp. X2]|uniref:flagellar hook assembly protein FlgD n=1 Tax=Desulfovibrio sp. X2 TaxID=941449 RepID=UPI0003587A86|nr:flagellar hook capping FlgD N-terminal domain-containing protein [Desulfovibrio sp. X2]EPR43887.1 flagellar hook capping protein [Desulfovibrio sp. X2]
MTTATSTYAYQGIGQAETTFNPDGTTSVKKDLDRDAFLTLLCAQLGHQDPLNPMEDKEFTSQLASFSQLEQLTQINDGIGKMIDASSRQEVLSAVGFIGKNVLADGNTLSKLNGTISTAYYTIDSPVSDVYVNITDKDGNVIDTIHGGAMQAGTYSFTWDGKDWQGNDMADGVYGLSIAATGSEGEPVLVDTQVTGTVGGVSTDNGTNYLRLMDGRTVKFTDVKEVANPSTTTASSGSTSSGNDSSSGSSNDSGTNDSGSSTSGS